MVYVVNAGIKCFQRRINVLHNRLFLNTIRNNNNDIGGIMELATEVFIDMMKSKEIYIILGGAIMLWIVLERMDK